jgi:mRNA interferase MazF
VLIENSLDITVCFITTQTGWKEPTDILVTPSAENGIRKESLIRTSKIATLDKTLAKGLLGKLSQEQVVEMNKNLVKLFGLS